jgi:hypothetical protein
MPQGGEALPFAAFCRFPYEHDEEARKVLGELHKEMGIGRDRIAKHH